MSIEEIRELEQQLSDTYKAIADGYRRMRKVKDEPRLNAMQQGIDFHIKKSLEIRDKIVAGKKQIMDEWNKSRLGDSHSKSIYD